MNLAAVFYGCNASDGKHTHMINESCIIFVPFSQQFSQL